MIQTDYRFRKKWNKCVAVLADIHARRQSEFLPILEKRKPDYIIVPGDFVDGKMIKKTIKHDILLNEANNLLNRLSSIAPTYFSLGNHEKLFTVDERNALKNNNSIPLFDEYKPIIDGLFIGGLSSAKELGVRESRINKDFLDVYESIVGFKILLCHHPEYYTAFLKNRKFDLIVSGHAHGGQIRIGNMGLFAPGQGIFPKYTNGIIDGKLIISRGIAGTEVFPRINNKPEIVYIEI